MRTVITAWCVLAITLAGHAEAQNERLEYALVIHGGAGKPPASAERRTARRDALRQALTKGRQMLAAGATALDTVETVIRLLENSEYFNAGRGAVMNVDGQHELDASIMDGATHAGGAVGGVITIKNPISLARMVMVHTRHVLLVSDGAERFADELGTHQIERVPSDYFSTPYQQQKLEDVQRAEQQGRDTSAGAGGTVGCVVLDRKGNLAAGTSTGGLTNKRMGRIGDTPILTAGNYADNATCAVSCTGTGEDFIRYAVAYDVSARIRYRQQPLTVAVREILHDPDRLVRGGIIAVDRHGVTTMQFNSQGMARARADSSGLWEIGVAE